MHPPRLSTSSGPLCPRLGLRPQSTLAVPSPYQALGRFSGARSLTSRLLLASGLLCSLLGAPTASAYLFIAAGQSVFYDFSTTIPPEEFVTSNDLYGGFGSPFEGTGNDYYGSTIGVSHGAQNVINTIRAIDDASLISSPREYREEEIYTYGYTGLFRTTDTQRLLYRPLNAGIGYDAQVGIMYRSLIMNSGLVPITHLKIEYDIINVDVEKQIHARKFVGEDIGDVGINVVVQATQYFEIHPELQGIEKNGHWTHVSATVNINRSGYHPWMPGSDIALYMWDDNSDNYYWDPIDPLRSHDNIYAIDNLRITAIPEPMTVTGISGAAVILLRRYRRRPPS
jgi:hypothetical protein